MSIQERRERELGRRERLIVAAARELAETDGWDAVTTRRLAEQVEYSQPVLYRHFKDKNAIVAAVALDGFAELAAQLHAARCAACPRQALGATSAAYTKFADDHPALYDAMFSRAVGLPFAPDEAPAALRAGFAELVETVRPHAADDEPGLLAETFWAALHGLVVLTRAGRLPRHAHGSRLEILLAHFRRE
ncbi:TetR/AcrR family transcriptional regulator [Amycolatopsis sp.]|uniref:TetR/AcrR family transcriptional regulator n=1 Tax=Amycolatopsis sp. TaxID=37632 RepID=UPI002B64CA2E|nr:TetR/AcrR family transcriptional regulator [Amycolatopsis sp.]HVV14615.1 TetR/AcrR family transcriptional regulator [Amycolatopsis sp.]